MGHVSVLAMKETAGALLESVRVCLFVVRQVLVWFFAGVLMRFLMSLTSVDTQPITSRANPSACTMSVPVSRSSPEGWGSCIVCGATEKLMRCSKCKCSGVEYCGRGCQVRSIHTHTNIERWKSSSASYCVHARAVHHVRSSARQQVNVCCSGRVVHGSAGHCIECAIFKRIQTC
jgi:hypothetical protein